MENAQFYTYLHCRPDGSPFYVGKGKGKRSHNFYHRSAHHKNIVAKYGRENIQVIVTKKDSEESAFKSEIRLIKMMRWAGFELCNYTDGGEGTSGRVYSAATLEKMSEAKVGTALTAEHRAKIASTLVGNKRSSGYQFSEEQRAKVSAGLSGKKRAPFSEQHLKNLSLSHKGATLSPEHRAKISAAGRGKKRSPETCKRMSEARKASSARNK